MLENSRSDHTPQWQFVNLPLPSASVQCCRRFVQEDRHVRKPHSYAKGVCPYLEKSIENFIAKSVVKNNTNMGGQQLRESSEPHDKSSNKQYDSEINTFQGEQKRRDFSGSRPTLKKYQRNFFRLKVFHQIIIWIHTHTHKYQKHQKRWVWG